MDPQPVTCQQLLETLPDQYLIAFSLYYGLNDSGWNLTKASIARVLGLSDKRVDFLIKETTRVLSMSPCLSQLRETV